MSCRNAKAAIVSGSLTDKDVENDPGTEVGNVEPPFGDPGFDDVLSDDLHDDVELQRVREEDGQGVEEESQLSGPR